MLYSISESQTVAKQPNSSNESYSTIRQNRAPENPNFSDQANQIPDSHYNQLELQRRKIPQNKQATKSPKPEVITQTSSPATEKQKQTRTSRARSTAHPPDDRDHQRAQKVAPQTKAKSTNNHVKNKIHFQKMTAQRHSPQCLGSRGGSTTAVGTGEAAL